MASNGVPSPPAIHRTVQTPPPLDLPPALGAAVYPGGMACDDRSANLITTWPAQTHNPTLWQYSAPIDYPPFPPVGFQLVRDPITGHFLLIPASNLEALQRAILWPSYQPTPPQMIIPPISVQPTTPHLLLDTNGPAPDFLAPEGAHHSPSQHRILIAADGGPKRKMPTPTLIKVEASDCSNAVVVTPCDDDNIYSKTQASTLSPGGESVFYSQRSSAAVESGRRSQATSPAPFLTSVSENQRSSSEPLDKSSDSRQPTTVTLQDASNQTDMPLEIESVRHQASIPCYRDKFKPYTKITEQNVTLPKTQDVGTETEPFREAEDDKQMVLREIQKRKGADRCLNIHISNVPDVNIKKEIISPSQVDLSGLELLSNSIEQFVCEENSKKLDTEPKEELESSVLSEDRKDLSNDACEGAVLLQNLKNGFREINKSETYKEDNSKSLGGLGLLCALAEQRFQEEIGGETNDEDSLDTSIETELKKEDKDEDEDDEEDEVEEEVLRENEMDEVDEEEEAEEELKNNDEPIKEQETKKENLDGNYTIENGFLPSYKKETQDCDLNSNYRNEIESFHKVKTETESMEEFSHDINEAVKIRNKFKKIRTVSDSSSSSPKRGPGRPKKTTSNSSSPTPSTKSNRKLKEMSPPVLEKETDFSFTEDTDDTNDCLKLESKRDISTPPTLTPSATLNKVPGVREDVLELPKCEVKIVKLDQIKKSEGSESSEGEARKRKSTDITRESSSSKKRKVGRPKKHHLLDENPLTETIVAKKPKAKSSFMFQSVNPSDNSTCLKIKKTEVAAEKCLANVEKRKSSFVKIDGGAMDLSSENDDKKSKKIRPKLKAEPKVREWTPVQDEDSLDWRKTAKKEENCKQKTKTQKKMAVTEGENSNKDSGTIRTRAAKLPSCVLTAEHLSSHGDGFPVRTLTAMGGLFYAGQLSAIRAPDVYGVTIDGERGNRPHIYSREEILNDSILEVKPEKTSDLVPGTRCCAYWSEQYRCLYPGTVSAPASPDPELDEKFVNVEFDDGDSGRINIDDIRLLPEDYPIVEYDPNPLQSLCKRKRRISGASVESHSKERKSIDCLSVPDKGETIDEKVSAKTESNNEEAEPKKLIQIYEPGTFLSLESERRHLKKKRREKLKRLQSLSIDGKKKHKKHRCSDEHRHHRHHKKHRKHKHKHGKRHESDVSGEVKKRDEKSDDGSTREKSEPSAAKKKNKNKCKSAEKSCKISDKSKAIKPKKCKERTESVESRSKMAAFLPARQLWGWSGKGYKRPGAKGRARKEFYKTIQRGKERITVGDCAVFLSTGRPDRPYIGRIESMWESWGTNMIVKVKWFYHPEETVGCPATLEYPGALFESPHVDENDVQTISHKCEVLPLKEYTAKIGNEPQRYETIYDNNDIYYLAGYYDPTNTTLKMEPGVK